MIRSKRIEAGDWRTVESFWNANGTAFFKLPVGASIKVRYGVGFLGFDRQKQTLNGSNYKKLSVGTGSIARARMQIKVSQTTDVTYDVYGGGSNRLQCPRSPIERMPERPNLHDTCQPPGNNQNPEQLESQGVE